MREGRRVRAARAAVRADRDGADGRDRDLARARARPSAQRSARARPRCARASDRSERVASTPRLAAPAWSDAGRTRRCGRRARSGGRRCWSSVTAPSPRAPSTRPRSWPRRGARASSGSASSSPTATAPRWPALGCVRALEAAARTGSGAWPRRWRAVVAAALADAPERPGRARACSRSGGFAFAPDGGAVAPRGRASRPRSLVVPELSLARRGGRTCG